MNNWNEPMELLEIGKARCIAEGKDIAILGIGHAGNFVVDAMKQLALDGINPGHFDMRFLSPIDEDILHHVFKNYSHVITVEDGSVTGGLSSVVTTFKNKNNYSNTLVSLGIPNKFITHGDVETLHKVCGYDADGIMAAVEGLM